MADIMRRAAPRRPRAGVYLGHHPLRHLRRLRRPRRQAAPRPMRLRSRPPHLVPPPRRRQGRHRPLFLSHPCAPPTKTPKRFPLKHVKIVDLFQIQKDAQDVKCSLSQDAHALDLSASMEKRSRRRRLLLRPFPLPLPLRFLRFDRFTLSSPHAVRLQMGEKGRQIRRSAPMANISKLKRGRSRVTPRRTCQTLTSVEAASMSDKCEIRFDADPIQGASGGPGQVAQVSNFEATHRGPSSGPPLDLLKFPDEFKLLEKDRLLPCDLTNTNPNALQQYNVYLDWFYNTYRGPAPVASLADTASKCLEKENNMASLWRKSGAYANVPCNRLHGRIITYMQIVIEEKGRVEHPYAFDAGECLAKESELICEWLRRGHRAFNDDQYAVCHNIRTIACVLFLSSRKWSSHIAAALLAIRKEAEWLIENLKCDSGESISTSMKIRKFALLLLCKKYNELEPCTWGYEESSESESEIEMSSESDDDVAESQVNDYVGGYCDQLYMKFYRRTHGSGTAMMKTT